REDEAPRAPAQPHDVARVPRGRGGAGRAGPGRVRALGQAAARHWRGGFRGGGAVTERGRDLPLERQVVVVTGASSGIGLATARLAAQRGATVVLVSRNEP